MHQRDENKAQRVRFAKLTQLLNGKAETTLWANASLPHARSPLES